ncbi:MAG TPA: hypothetical protein VD902_22545 [Symbiobacteriaceae bacterium]|nr:hypothetical protein [Symbiobacteriaceae bacterium]
MGQTFFTPGQLELISQAAGPGGRVELNAFMQLIVHTSLPDLHEQHLRLRNAGLAIYPAGPVVKNLHTCSFCAGEKTDGLPDACRLDAAVAGAAVPFPLRVGFSGCSSNCAEAMLRDIGVVRMDEGRYDVYIGGRASTLTPAFGQKVASGLPADRLVPAVEVLLRVYRETARGRERLWKNIARVGLEPYEAAVAATQTEQGHP